MNQENTVKFCSKCGACNDAQAQYCFSCGLGALAPNSNQPAYPMIQPPVYMVIDIPKSRGVYVALGLLLGGLGIHNFYAGRIGAAVAQLLITLLTFWLVFPLFFVAVWVIVEVCAIDTDGQGRRMR